MIGSIGLGSAGGPGIWSEMKENAERPVADEDGAFREIAPLLSKLAKQTELHIVAHSAGSIYFARLVQWLTAPASTRVAGMKGLATPIDSVTLWARRSRCGCSARHTCPRSATA